MYNQESRDKQVNGGRKWCCFTNAGPGYINQTSPEKVTFLWLTSGAFVGFLLWAWHAGDQEMMQQKELDHTLSFRREIGDRYH